jgi:hypothetical protein
VLHSCRFFAVWDDHDSKYGVLGPYIIQYYLADDTVEVQEAYRKNDLLLRRMKLPKDWKAVPGFASVINI